MGISLKDITVESNKRLLSDVMEALSNDMFDDLDITNQDTTEFISNNPNIAKALLALHDEYKNIREDMQNRLETIDVESVTNENKSNRLPVEIVSDFIQENKNYFDVLEKKADIIRKKINFEDGHRTIGYTLIQYLLREHNTNVKVVPFEEDAKSVKRFD